ncbi:MAG: glycosyltransferase family 1 protein [Armatimonadota bacterium]|nr:glycosyltransferase family 1 protein [Armatimonadota bacterium]
MRVGLDLWHATLASGGIGRYAVELTKSLVALNSEQPGVRYVLFPGRGPAEWITRMLAEHSPVVSLGTAYWKLPRAGIPARVVRSTLCVARRSRGLELNVLHCMDFLDVPLAPLGKVRIVATVHDISPILYPDTFTRRHAIFFRALARPLLHKAERLVTVSRSAASEIAEWDKTLREKLSVVYPGVGTEFRPAEPGIVDELRKQYRLPRDYVLCLATVQPRKNLSRLLDAYAMLARRDPSFPLLAVAGRLGWLYRSFVQAIRDNRLENRIRYLGFVPDEHLPALLTGAKALVFPSLHEGFGLPVLEAMACGTPVVTSNRSSLPEVAGDAALLVDPLDVESIAWGIERIVANSKLAAELVQRGFQRATRFSWETAAREVLDVYRSCVSEFFTTRVVAG